MWFMGRRWNSLSRLKIDRHVAPPRSVPEMRTRRNFAISRRVQSPNQAGNGWATLVTNLHDYITSGRKDLPQAAEARWASLFFSLHVLTLLLSLTVSQTLLAASGVGYVIHLLRNRPGISFPRVKLPLFLFCLATLNSLLWARDPALGGFALRKLVLFIILLLGVNLVTSIKQLRLLLQGTFFVSALAGLVGAAQFVIQYHTLRRSHPNQVYYFMTLTRNHGFMGHWMNFGGQQMLVFTVLLAFLLLSASPAEAFPGRERRNKWIYGLLMAAVATSIVLNFTRGVWLGSLVAILYVVARWKPRVLWAIPVLLFVLYLASPNMIRRRISLAFHPADDPALAIRLEMWHAGLKMVREHPWAGVGLDNVRLVYTEYLPPGVMPRVGFHDHLHDNFLQIAAERGLPCLAVWMWFMLALGWRILGTRRNLSRERWVADAAFAAWLAFMVEGFFEFNFGTSPVLMVFLFVMSAPFAAEQIERRAKESKATGLADEKPRLDPALLTRRRT